MNQNLQNNIAKISGKVTEYEYYHTILGESFYSTNVHVKRKSGEVDILPVVVSEKLLDNSIKEATFLEFEGQIRTFNKKDGSTDTYLFAKDIRIVEEGTYTNEVSIRGFLCKKGNLRTTYTDRKVLDFILAVNRHYEKSDYVAIIAWGKDAKYVSNREISEEFCVKGRFQSRLYRKKNKDGIRELRHTYEISSYQILVANK